jgi:hypothetical protein
LKVVAATQELHFYILVLCSLETKIANAINPTANEKGYRKGEKIEDYILLQQAKLHIKIFQSTQTNSIADLAVELAVAAAPACGKDCRIRQ